jgi:putative transposase
MIEQHDLTDRRACRLVGLSRDAFRHTPQASELNQELASRITEVAHLRRRFGYRRIHDVLRPACPDINHKRVYRLYAEAGLAVRKRRTVKRPSNERQPLLPATTINEVWSMDFVSDSPTNGRRLKLLTVTDDFSRGCVDIAVDYGISGPNVTGMLHQAALFRGYPRAVRTDNGPEFTSRAFLGWASPGRLRLAVRTRRNESQRISSRQELEENLRRDRQARPQGADAAAWGGSGRDVPAPPRVPPTT